MIPENLIAVPLPTIENTSIRQRQTVCLLSPSFSASLRTESAAEVPSMSLRPSMNRSGRWMRPMADQA